MLALDTAGSACSVAVGAAAAVLAHQRRDMRHGHAEALLPMVDAVMKAAGLTPSAVDVIAVSVGPGGFTGIRAGLAAAHGLALAAGARLLGISSFVAVAARIPAGDTRLLVALDSRRADLYVQLFDAAGDIAAGPRAILPENLASWVGGARLRIAGDAAEDAAGILSAHSGAEVVPASPPDALGLLAAVRRWPALADPAAQPLYLRPPDVTLPRDRTPPGDRPVGEVA